MHKWPVPTGLVRQRARPHEFAVLTTRHFHQTALLAEAEDQPASRNPPIRSRAANTSAQVWNQIERLPTRAPNPTVGRSFEEAVRARPIGSSLSRGASTEPPRELVRRRYVGGDAAPQTQRGGRGGYQGGARGGFQGGARGGFQGGARGGFQGGARGGYSGGTRGGGVSTRGRGRGGAPGRGRGGGGGAFGARKRRGFAGEDTDAGAEEEEDDDEEYTGYYQVLTSDEYVENFASLEEAQSYANVQEFVDDYEEAHDVLAQGEAELRQKGEWSAADAKEKEALLGRMDDDIKEALQAVVDADEKALPRHEPEPFPLDTQRGELGGVPVGPTGFANIMEDGLRHLANRQNNEWEDPRALARKLVAGEFIKFRNPPEREEVLAFAERLGYKADTPDGAAAVGFEEPSEAAKKVLVGRFVRGRYADPGDEGLRGEVLRNAARIVGGNATISPGGKGVLLKTIRELLPVERQGSQRTQRGR